MLAFRSFHWTCLCAALSIFSFMAGSGFARGSDAGLNAPADTPAPKPSKAVEEGFLWPNRPPKDCPFEQSEQFSGVYFTGRHHDRNYGDTWYPSWAADGNLYSPWTDGTTEGAGSWSIGLGETTGQAVMIGDDPQKLLVKNTAPPQKAGPKPYAGRYPCGSLVYNGVWYYGTYCLGPAAEVEHDGFKYNWPVMGPMPGFRTSTDYGKTWTPSPLSPEKPLFPEPAKFMGPLKMGAPHFVDFGKNMQHSPDGKAYLVGMGAEENDPQPRYANLSWGSADQLYLARVTPSIANINDLKQYEFFAGHDAAGKPLWTADFAKIKPLLDWNNNLGVATITYDAPLKKYLMCVTDGWPTVRENEHLYPRSRCNHRAVALGDLHERLRRAGLLRQHPLEIHQRRRPHALALLLGQFRPRLERPETRIQSPRRLLRPVPARIAPARVRRNVPQKSVGWAPPTMSTSHFRIDLHVLDSYYKAGQGEPRCNTHIN